MRGGFFMTPFAVGAYEGPLSNGFSRAAEAGWAVVALGWTQFRHANEVVSGDCEVSAQLGARSADESGFSEVGDGLEPAKDLFDAFALALAYLVARPAGGTAIERGTLRPFEVLSDVGRDPEFATTGDKAV